MTPTLYTDRLTLRPVRENDVNEIYRCWMNDPDVSRFMYWKASSDIQETYRFVEYELENLDNDFWNRWIICKKESGDIVGTCLVFFNDEEKKWDISYNLGKQYWGHGYITEAMKAAIVYAETHLGMRKCIASHAVENAASEKVIKKLGFEYIKDIPFECSGGELLTTGKYYTREST